MHSLVGRKEKNRNMLHYCVSFEAYFCLSYEQVNYCKIANSIIKTAYYLIKDTFLYLYLYF